MDRHIIKSLLEDYIEDVRLTAEQLAEAQAFLFNQVTLFNLIKDPVVQDATEYLREIVEENGFQDLGDLVNHYDEKKKSYGKFLWEIITAGSNEEARNNDSVQENMLLVTRHETEHNDMLIFPDLALDNNQFLKTLSFYFKGMVGSIRSKFSSCKEITIQLDGGSVKRLKGKSELVCSWRKNKFGKYFEKFSSEKDSNILFALRFDAEPDSILEPNLHGHEGNMVCFNGSGYSYSGSKAIAKLYDDIVHLVEREQPIEDESIKEEILEWLCYSKLFSSEAQLIKNVMAEISRIPTSGNVRLITKSSPKDFYTSQLRADYRSTLVKKRWIILKSPPGYGWLTSDNPGFGLNLSDLYKQPSQLMADGALKEIRSDTLIYYPLSSDYCLRIQPPTGNVSGMVNTGSAIGFEQSSIEELEIVNGLTFSTKNEIVLGRDVKSLKQLEEI